MKSITPDIIIEVTSVCDRSCQGCYAPNVLSKDDPAKLLKERPDLFINQFNLNKSLVELFKSNETKVQSLFIRGGEPSLHPELPVILNEVRRFSNEIYIETHGRWLLDIDENESTYKEKLAKACVDENITLKISFDKMHGLSSIQLKEIVTKADLLGINYVLAITEKTIEDFRESMSRIPFVDKNKLIFQRKAIYSEQLVRPSIAIINVSGQINIQLTNHLRSQFEV